MKFLLLTFFIIVPTLVGAQYIERLEPPNWWIGFKDKSLQIIIYGQDISTLKPAINYPGVSLQEVITTENSNYMFLNLQISEGTQAGNFDISFSKAGKVLVKHPYTLALKNSSPTHARGFSSADTIYLITPDRFANGNPDNDNLEDRQDQADRRDVNGRHGGDIQGIIDHLDYIKDMGFTAIWLNPILENRMPQHSYHGYATTDFYKADPRFGKNEEYRELVQRAKQKGMGVIMDMIVNHSGAKHWWMEDPPTSDWFNLWQPDGYGQTSHKHTANIDRYASQYDRKYFTDGWFVPTMPDLNQRKQLLARYLIQNALWWIEYLGLAGIRMDTYPYSDKHFMAEWTRRIMEEYPAFNIVGEEWQINPALVAYWQAGRVNPDNYISHLPSLMDFPLQQALVEALKSPETDSLMGIYEMLVNDILYPHPEQLVIFPDNHDMDRIFTQLDEDIELFKMAIGYFLTIRGIPQFYYGTEILMGNRIPNSEEKGGHGVIRNDFPGGWKGDKINAFTGKGLSKEQAQTQAFVKKLLNWRKANKVISEGNLTHFIPEEGVYVYFRSLGNQLVMVALNKNTNASQLDTKRFAEFLKGKLIGHEIITGKSWDITQIIKLPRRSITILEIGN